MHLAHMIPQQSPFFISFSTNVAIYNIFLQVYISDVILKLLHRDEAVWALLPHVNMNIFVMGQSIASLVEAPVTNRTMELSALFIQDGRGH